MLSFLRESGLGSLSTEKQTGNSNQSCLETLEDTQSKEYITVAAQNRNVRRTTILVAILFGIGLLSLWFMIKKSSPQTASAAPNETEETQIEIAITRLTGVRSEVFDKMDEILKKFYEFSNVLQVQVNELVKNPFELEFFLASLRDKSKETGLKISAEMLRQQQIKKKANNIKLLSIIQLDQRKCCMIDDNILYEGDLVNGFKITQIGDNFIKLKFIPEHDSKISVPQPQGIEIVLKLSE